MVGARSAAMALNRLIDAGHRRAQPAHGRHASCPARQARGEDVWSSPSSRSPCSCSRRFQLSPPCRYLWPILVAAFVVYPYTKRFTWLCHYALGLTDGLAPAAAWVAVSRQRRARRRCCSSSPSGSGSAASTSSTASSTSTSTAARACTRSRSRWDGAGPCSSPCSRTSPRSRCSSRSGLCSVSGWSTGSASLAVAALLGWSHVDIARRGLDAVGMGFMTVNGAVGLLYGAVVIVAVLLL